MQKENNGILNQVQKSINEAKEIFQVSDDIISVIKEDHKPLKELIKIMKNEDVNFNHRIKAFRDFAPLLLTHAKAEEKSLYAYMKSKVELREYGFEGYTEHGLADQLVEEARRSTNEYELAAKIKVLGELVEHHILEEENTIFPDVKLKVSKEILAKLTEKYTDVQMEIISEGQDESPSERELKGSRFPN